MADWNDLKKAFELFIYVKKKEYHHFRAMHLMKQLLFWINL